MLSRIELSKYRKLVILFEYYRFYKNVSWLKDKVISWLIKWLLLNFKRIMITEYVWISMRLIFFKETKKNIYTYLL